MKNEMEIKLRQKKIRYGIASKDEIVRRISVLNLNFNSIHRKKYKSCKLVTFPKKHLLC